MKKTILSLLFVFLAYYCNKLYAIDSYCLFKNNIYLSKNAVVYKHLSSTNFNYIDSIDIANQDLLLDSLTAKLVSEYHLTDFNKNKLFTKIRNGHIENMTSNNDFLFLQIQLFINKDNNSEIVFIKLNENLHIVEFYLLKNVNPMIAGQTITHPRFAYQINNNEFICPLLGRFDDKKQKDKIAIFSIYIFDDKRHEMRFKEKIYENESSQYLLGWVFNNKKQGITYYPINIPLNFSKNPTYLTFPYFLIKKNNSDFYLDPFNHVKLHKDSAANLLNGNMNNDPHNEVFNRLKIRHLPLGFYYQNDSFICLTKKLSDLNSVNLVHFINGKTESIKNFKLNYNVEETYFLVEKNQFIAINEINGSFIFKAYQF